MKIAFYIPNKGTYQKDLSNVDNGNPGIGGSEYSAILIASNLCKTTNIEILLLCDKKGIFPSMLQFQVCGCLESAMRFAEKKHFDYVIVDAKLLEEHILVRFYKLKFIAWANCFIEENIQKIFSKHTNLIQIVNVGAHQNELLKKANIVSKKSTYIFNAVPTAILNHYKGKITPTSERKHNVIYIGSIHKAKGFHCLAKVWPYILNKVPDAQLYVVGTGRLYGKNIKLGHWNIAQENYEAEFMPYLTKNGKILPSVHFMGIMGIEKYDLLNKCKVGVPNPWGESETFGYTAVEMEMMGCLVTTIKCPGYLDTIYDQSNLYENIDQLGEYVVKLLKTENNNYEETLKFIDRFSISQITKEWNVFLNSIQCPEAFPSKEKTFCYLNALITCKFIETKQLIKRFLKK